MCLASDIFSLGITALEMANLESIQGCYDFEKYSINFSALELQYYMLYLKFRL